MATKKLEQNKLSMIATNSCTLLVIEKLLNVVVKLKILVDQ